MAPITFSWETDNFTNRIELLSLPDEKVKADLYRINNQVNKSIELAIDNFNSLQKSSPVALKCHQDFRRMIPSLVFMVRNTLGTGIIAGNLENWVKQKDESGVYIADKEDDIYEAYTYNPDPPINLAGHIVGTDKLSHFFEEGYDFYEDYASHNDLAKAQKESEDTEEHLGTWGLSASGVKSYGDLQANFDGFLFYRNLLEGNDPYVHCNQDTGKYQLAKPFNFADYIDASYDEGVNCSIFKSYRGPMTPKKIREYNHTIDIDAVGKKLNKNIQKFYEENYSKHPKFKHNNFCPLESHKCKEITKKNCAKYVVSPQCLKQVDINSINFNCELSESGARPIKNHKFKDYNYGNIQPASFSPVATPVKSKWRKVLGI